MGFPSWEMPPPGGRAPEGRARRGAFHPPSKALSRSRVGILFPPRPGWAGTTRCPPPAAAEGRERCRGAGEMPRGAGAARGEGKGFSRDWARFPVLWLKPVNMAAIGRGRSLKNLRIRGKSAAALTPRRPATATPGTCLPRALGGWSEPGRWSEPGLPPLAWERILIGAMCLFRAGRNDSGEENVPLDLTRGNAGRWRGRPTGEEPGLGAAGRDRPRTGPARVRETEPEPEPRLPARGSKSGAVFPAPSPFPVPAFLSPSPFPGLWVLRCSGAPSGIRRSRRPSGFSRLRGERSRPIPELKQPNPRGGRREVEAVI